MTDPKQLLFNEMRIRYINPNDVPFYNVADIKELTGSNISADDHSKYGDLTVLMLDGLVEVGSDLCESLMLSGNTGTGMYLGVK